MGRDWDHLAINSDIAAIEVRLRAVEQWLDNIDKWQRGFMAEAEKALRGQKVYNLAREKELLQLEQAMDRVLTKWRYL